MNFGSCFLIVGFLEQHQSPEAGGFALVSVQCSGVWAGSQLARDFGRTPPRRGSVAVASTLLSVDATLLRVCFCDAAGFARDLLDPRVERSSRSSKKKGGLTTRGSWSSRQTSS